jgi:hypothetical protein
MNKGLSTKQFILEILESKERTYEALISLDEQELNHYTSLLTNLEDMHHSGSAASTTEKGKALEQLVTYLIQKSIIFDVYQNLRTSSNEIDQLFILNAKGRAFREEGLLPLKDDLILSECKNYQNKISVTWVGKFYSLISSTSAKVGLLFSYHGLTGTGWRDAVGLTKKIYLSKERLEDKVYILDFNITDFRRIRDGENLPNLINAKMLALRTDTNFQQFISKHPAENDE